MSIETVCYCTIGIYERSKLKKTRRWRECLSLFSVLCQVDVSVTGWSFVQRSPTECGVSECGHESLTMRRPWPTRGCYAMVVYIYIYKYICVYMYIYTYWGPRQWLRCCASNRKVAGSIPAGVSGFFIDIKSFRSHYGPGVDSASNRNEYQEYFLGVKAAGA